MSKQSVDIDPVYLNNLEPEDRIYLGLDPFGGLLSRPHISIWSTAEGPDLPERCLLALGLTEVCRRKGKGKGLWSFARLPKLIYVPFVWGESDKDVWDSLKHQHRLQILNARAGCLMLEDLVMSIEITYDPEEKETFKINALIDANSGSKAILAIIPRAYIGWYSELQKGTPTRYGRDEIWGAYYMVDRMMLADHRVEDAEQVTDKLWIMYHHPIDGALVWYREILETLLEVFKHMGRQE
ncbi:MAG: hypothetical protein Q9223_002979 [Gallowayella weberi]